MTCRHMSIVWHMTAELLTTREVARLLGIARQTVVRRVEAGRLTPAYRAPNENGMFLFNRAEIEALAAKEREARSCRA